ILNPVQVATYNYSGYELVDLVHLNSSEEDENPSYSGTPNITLYMQVHSAPFNGNHTNSSTCNRLHSRPRNRPVVRHTAASAGPWSWDVRYSANQTRLPQLYPAHQPLKPLSAPLDGAGSSNTASNNLGRGSLIIRVVN
ncbi:unnamed protein product, partial [Nesidiocoris tenuis]